MFKILLITLFMLQACIVYSKPEKVFLIATADNTSRIRNIQPIILFWKSVFKDRKQAYTIEKYSLLEQKDQQTGKAFWILLGTNKDGCIKIAMQLFLSGKKIVFNSESIRKGLVTCSGNPKVCTIPTMLDGQWACAKECGTDCTKTVTVFYSEKAADQLSAFINEFN